MTTDDRDKNAQTKSKQGSGRPEQTGPFMGTSTTRGSVAKIKASMPVLGAWQAVNGTNHEQSRPSRRTVLPNLPQIPASRIRLPLLLRQVQAPCLGPP